MILSEATGKVIQRRSRLLVSHLRYGLVSSSLFDSLTRCQYADNYAQYLHYNSKMYDLVWAFTCFSKHCWVLTSRMRRLIPRQLQLSFLDFTTAVVKKLLRSRPDEDYLDTHPCKNILHLGAQHFLIKIPTVGGKKKAMKRCKVYYKKEKNLESRYNCNKCPSKTWTIYWHLLRFSWSLTSPFST